MAFDFQTFAWSVVTTGGGTAVIAYSAVKVFGGKWIDSRLTERLQALKHINDEKLAHLKAEIDGQHDRVVKLNHREFEIIPEVWKYLTEAHHALLRLISPWQESPDVGRMSEPQFESFLADCGLKEWQKTEIRERDRFQRTTYYSEAAKWMRLNDANQSLASLNRSLLGSSIFIHPNTYGELQAIADALGKAFNRFRVDMQMGDEYRSHLSDSDNPVSLYLENGPKKL